MEENEPEESGPIGKVFAGVGMIVGGGIWTFLAWQAGYIVPSSFVLMGIGVFSIIAGMIESAR